MSAPLPLGTWSAKPESACQRWSPTYGATPIAEIQIENLGRGKFFNLAREGWEEPNNQEKEEMMGYMANETECPHEASEGERSMRLGRALDANVMLHLGAVLFAAHA